MMKTKSLNEYVPEVSFELIPIRNLVSNQKYQRSVSYKHVRAATEHFDLRQINPVKVSRRDGINYVFNGQHTIEIVAAVSGSRDTPVWCMVYNDLEYVEEADIFANQQKYQKRLSPFDQFNGRMEADESKALLIRDLVESYGMTLSSNQTFGGICAVAALESVYDKYGYHVLDRTLRILFGTWEGEPDSLSGNFLRAVALLIHTFDEELDEERFKEKLGNVTFRYINRNAREYNKGATGYALVMLESYNQKLKNPLDSKRLLSKKAREVKKEA